jgi:hypothetical protein
MLDASLTIEGSVSQAAKLQMSASQQLILLHDYLGL